MGVFQKHFPLGLGTARFPVADPNDARGLEESVRLVLRALEAGVDYIDVGYNYSAGMSVTVLKEAFRRTTRPFSVTAKTAYDEDKTGGDARRRIASYLKALDVDHVDYFTCWRIASYEDFTQICRKGGIYESALRLRDEGVIRHICCSLHAPVKDMVRIIESGAFEGATISYSLINAVQMQPVLDAAARRGVSIAVMNPLCGGLIAHNRDAFSYACGEGDGGDAVHAALRFVMAHPAVELVLGGVSCMEELEDSLKLFSTPDPEPPEERLVRVRRSASELKGVCTGCKYCEGCPQGIPTYALMQARNALMFKPMPAYNRQGPEELLYDLQIFRKLHVDHGWMPDSTENPCVGCGKCEAACTQNLEIIRGVADVYRRAEQRGYSLEAHRARLRELLHGKGYRRVGLYPNGGFAREVMRIYQEDCGDAEFEWLLFNSDRKLQGTQSDKRIVHHSDEIPTLRPDVILICSYRYEEDIAATLRPYEARGIRVEKLHRQQDIPWWLF